MTTDNGFMELFYKHLSNNQTLLGSSRNQNIVITLGTTGSGKSALLNFLFKNELFYDQSDQDIKLKYQETANSFPIGHSACSETIFPKFLKLNDVLFYDFPGMNDTRGSFVNLCNASFIKNITEGAKSVKILFVIGQDQITAGRADSLGKVFDAFTKCFSCRKRLEDCSMLIVTKTGMHSSQGLSEYLHKKVRPEDLVHINSWIKQNRVFPMSTSLLDSERAEILNQLSDLNFLDQIQVNIAAILSENAVEHIKNLYKKECERIIEQTKQFYDNSRVVNSNVDDEIDFYENVFKCQAKMEFSSSEIIRILNEFGERIRIKHIYKFKRSLDRKRLLHLSKLKLLQSQNFFDIISQESNLRCSTLENELKHQREASELRCRTLENELKHQTELYLEAIKKFNEVKSELDQNKLMIESYKKQLNEKNYKFQALNNDLSIKKNNIQATFFFPEANTFYRIKNASTGHVVNSWEHDLGNNSLTYEVDHSPTHNHRHWRFIQTSEIGVYIIQNIFSGNYLSVEYYEVFGCVPVMLNGYDPNDRCKKWKIIFCENGYKINSISYSDLYLKANGKIRKGSGELCTDSNSEEYRWYMVRV